MFNNVNVVKKKQKQQFFIVYTIVDCEHEVKMLKPCSETTCLQLIYGSTWVFNILTSLRDHSISVSMTLKPSWIITFPTIQVL